MKLPLALLSLALLTGCQNNPGVFTPPDSYIGVVRPESATVMLVRPGEAQPGPDAELLGRYLRNGEQLEAKDAVKLARRIGANFIIYSARVIEGSRRWSGPGWRRVEPGYENDVLFYRDPSRPGIE